MSTSTRRRGNTRSRRPASAERRRRDGEARARETTTNFWGDPAQLPEARQDVTITQDPSAVARSLGPPPLAGHEAVAEHYFTAVYDRTVILATALAAAGGLIQPEELLDEE